MRARLSLATLPALLIAAVPLHAANLEPLHASCFVSAAERGGGLRLRIEDTSCKDDGNCGMFSNDSMNRFTGIALSDLSREGAQLTAQLKSDAGTFACAGTVRQGVLTGTSTFTPDSAFVERMGRMGFNGFDSNKLQACTFFDITEAWVQSLKNAGINGLTTDNLIALRIFHIDPAYMTEFTRLGYETPDADKLIALKVQGVNAQEVREIRDLGFQPSLDELIQVRIFHITPDFIRRMQSRGLKDLTISKLVQIKIFKLDE